MENKKQSKKVKQSKKYIKKVKIMPQAILPLFLEDVTEINFHIGIKRKGDTVYWFHGSMPVFCHHVNNQKAFRMFCCQLINNGNATSADIARALNVNREKLSRWARLDRVSNSIKPDYKKKIKER